MKQLRVSEKMATEKSAAVEDQRVEDREAGRIIELDSKSAQEL